MFQNETFVMLTYDLPAHLAFSCKGDQRYGADEVLNNLVLNEVNVGIRLENSILEGKEHL